MVNAAECVWTKEQAKALITFLIAEKRRHQRDIDKINQNIQRLKREYNLTETEIKECEERAYLFIYF